MYFWENWRFLTKYGLDSRGFFMKILKKWHSNTVFLREWTFFWQNIDLRAVCFLENGRFFTKYGHKSDDFFVRNRKKKGIILTSLAHNIVLFWQNWRFLIKYGHDSRGFFMFFLIDIRAQCFWENGRFFEKMGMRVVCFQRIDVFSFWKYIWALGSNFFLKNW